MTHSFLTRRSSDLVSSVNVVSYGGPDYKLITHMRDTVAAIRHVIGNAHKGLSPYRGAYYNADFQELMLTAPPERENLPIWVAALRERLTDTALEIDRKSTRLTPVTNAHLVCRLLLEKKKKLIIPCKRDH